MLPKLFSSSKTTDDRNQPASLALESLENRMMLSSVQIFAAGTTGTESLDLRINDVVVSTFENVGGDASNRQFQQLTFDTPQNITAGEARLEFTNDLFRPEDGFDRNIVIDRIVVDGVTFETESPSTFSTGVFRDGGVTDPGFLQTETLNINGSFFYSNDGASAPTASTGTTLQIKAFGSTGDEQLQVRIDGNVVQTFSVTTTPDTYTFVSDQQVSVDQVQVEFTNDLFDPNNGIDRNLIVEQIQLVDRQTNETQTFITDSDSTFSTGTFLDADGIVDGFGRGNTLHANGFFRFAQTGTATDSLVIDQSFGVNGIATDVGNFSSSGTAVSPSGRFVRIGSTGATFSNNLRSQVFLFSADGTLINQTELGIIGRGTPQATSIEFGVDESIFIGQEAISTSPSSRIVKLTPEGEFDTSFGNNGILETESNSRSARTAVTSDGNLITGTRSGEIFVFTLRDPQGNLIESFGDGGTTDVNLGGLDANLFGLVVGIVATSDGGAILLTNDAAAGRNATKVSGDGTLDSSFGSNGTIFLGPQAIVGSSTLTDEFVLLVDSQDRLITGTQIIGENPVLQRFNANGQIDTSFGDNGTVTLSEEFASDNFQISRFDVDSQDRLVGYTSNSVGGVTTSIFRIAEDGNFDASLADGGVIVTAVNGGFSQEIRAINAGDGGSVFVTTGDGIFRFVPA